MAEIDKHIDALAELVERLEAPFVWDGALIPTEPIVLTFPGGAKLPLVASAKANRQKALDALTARASKAPFGVGRKTKVDPRVRDGLVIRADAGVTVSGLDSSTKGLLEAARATLAPYDPSPLEAVFYAVNIYEQGGRFAPHKDTPRGEDMLGTLVVCLPWRFTGGQLELANAGRRIVLDWAKDLARSSALPCAAFFGDVDHEIHPVTSGTRVTLSFLVRRTAPKGKAPKKQPTTDPVARAEEDLAARLRALAADPALTTHGAVLRFPCAHQYVAGPATPRASVLEDARALKGKDAVIARAAIAAGVEVSFVHCFFACDEDGVALDARLEQPPTPKTLAKLRHLVARNSGNEFSEYDIAAAAGATEGAPTRVVGHDAGAATHLGTGLFSPTGYYGNEAGEADFYAGAALDVAIAARGALPERRTVVHPKWGKGTVVAVSGEQADKKLRVRFESGEEKTLLERFVTFA